MDGWHVVAAAQMLRRAGSRANHLRRAALTSHALPCRLQAQAGGRIVARETLKAFRKNVLAKCYGGDVSR